MIIFRVWVCCTTGCKNDCVVRFQESKHGREADLLCGRSAPGGREEGDNKLDIPEDLLKDFLALRSATNLGTADLMRRLIHDYSK